MSISTLFRAVLKTVLITSFQILPASFRGQQTTRPKPNVHTVSGPSRHAGATLLSLLLCLIALPAARAQLSGKVDPYFAASLGLANNVFDVCLQPDGRIVVAGKFKSRIARLNADGSVDGSFTLGPGPSDVNAENSEFALALQSDGKILVGRQVEGYATSTIIIRLNPDGSIDPTFQMGTTSTSNPYVSSIAIQPDKKILVSGLFANINGVPRVDIARLNANGSVDTTFNAGTNGASGEISLQADGKILVVGRFQSVNGIVRAGFVRLNTDGSVDTAFDPAAQADKAIISVGVLPDGKLLLGGFFDTFSGVTRHKLVRVLATGALDPSFDPGITTGADTHIASLKERLADGRFYISGDFTSYGGSARPRIARLNAAGSLETVFMPGPDLAVYGRIFSIGRQPDGKLLFAGEFASFSGMALSCVARVNADGGLDTAFVPDSNLQITTAAAVALQSDGKVVVGGVAQSVPNVLRLAANGAADSAFGLGVGANGTVVSVAVQSDGKILAAGDFSTFNGQVRNYVARFNADGSVDSEFNPGAGLPSVNALAFEPEDSKVIIGGTFTTSSKQYANALARLRSDGSPDIGFKPPFSPDDSVLALQRQLGDGAIVASAVVPDNSPNFTGERFGHVRASTAARVNLGANAARPPIGPHVDSKIKNPIVRCLSASGSFDTTFSTGAGTNGIAYSLAIQQADGRIVVGGAFTQLNATVGHLNIGRLNADGTLDSSFNPTTNDAVQTVLVQPDGRIVLGGLFTQVNGVARARLVRLLGSNGSLDPGFSAAAGTDGPVTALRLQSDGRLVVSGTFALVNGTARSCVARLNGDGTLDASFVTGTISLTGGTASVCSIDQQVDGKLIIAGLFDHVGNAMCNKVARLNANGSLDTTFNVGNGPDAMVRAIKLQPDGRTLLGGDFTSVDTFARNAAARLLGDYDLSRYPPLGQWRIINFGSPNATGNAADTASPYGDGVPNLLKYALNLNAQAADSTPMTATGSKGLPLARVDSGGTHLTLTFVRRQAATTPRITYQVQFSNGLTSTFSPNAEATAAVTPIDATWERVTVTDSVSLLSQPRRFARLQVSSP